LFVAENRPYPGDWWYITIVNEENTEGANFYFYAYVLCADYEPLHTE